MTLVGRRQPFARRLGSNEVEMLSTYDSSWGSSAFIRVRPGKGVVMRLSV